MKLIKFPEDEQIHKHSVEWWYFNGHLHDKKGNNYSFMNCLFKLNLKRVDLPFIKKIPINYVYSAHSILSDLTHKKVYPSIDYIVVVSKDSFSKPLLFINYTNPLMINGYVNCEIKETKLFEYKLKTENIDLTMKSIKKPVLEGGDGYVDLGSKKTYYYSLTNLKTKGRIRIKDKWIEVQGKSWIDRQWIDIKKFHGVNDMWNWFSIQLDNNTEIVCFEYDDGKTKTRLASISYRNNKQEHTNDVLIIPTGKKWISPQTKEGYFLSWKILIPSKNIELYVRPIIKNQEMRFGSLNYWEGPIKVTGKIKNKKVKGVGFLELVGRPFQITDAKFLVKSAIDVVKKAYFESKNLFGL